MTRPVPENPSRSTAARCYLVGGVLVQHALRALAQREGRAVLTAFSMAIGIADDFTTPMAGEFSRGGAWQFTRPVLLLVGPLSVSATEDFASAMRELPHVTLVGATTGGSSGNPAVRTLGEGRRYRIWQWYFTTADGIAVEGQGIPPHAPVPATAADFAGGVDPVLECAAGWAANPTVRPPP